MSFLKSSGILDVHYVVDGDTVSLRAPQMADHGAWAQLRAESRDFLRPWEPTWSRDDLSRAAFRRRLRHYQRDMRSDFTYPFFIFRKSDDALVGGITLGNVRRGVAQCGSAGYWVGERYSRQGLMSAAMPVFVDYAFNILKLHRVEAACLSANTASIALLEKSGFQKEGFARQYLRINGEWRDHILFALIAAPPLPMQI